MGLFKKKQKETFDTQKVAEGRRIIEEIENNMDLEFFHWIVRGMTSFMTLDQLKHITFKNFQRDFEMAQDLKEIVESIFKL